ncbi:hypothetical protein, partial [Klebsiella pneumoniae]|uniref:hypothetical protein n=1 Tax=Klebsiella pneumoniae TaxID=573 RepID=UPI001D0F470A
MASVQAFRFRVLFLSFDVILKTHVVLLLYINKCLVVSLKRTLALFLFMLLSPCFVYEYKDFPNKYFCHH